MTTIYLVRHAQPDYSDVHTEPENAPLTKQGREDSKKMASFLHHEPIDVIVSSPYPRAKETIRPLAELLNLPILLEEDFRERKIGCWVEDFNGYCKRQWEDFSYALPEGESLQQVQQRVVQALEVLLQKYEGKMIAVAGHGTAISLLLNHFDPSFGMDDFMRIKSWMPWVVQLTFDKTEYLGKKEVFWIER